mmetsp:Transcript_12791/g.37545  ORF Transcript_12791/g.37545 Transcript_12791/m.37545 type:complete len:264 (+) Transcript_12791:949-1740(+)
MPTNALVVRDLSTAPDFAAINVSLRDGKPWANGKGRPLWINAGQEQSLCVLTPRLKAPFGASRFDGDDASSKWSITLNLDTGVPENDNLIALLEHVDDAIITHVHEHQSTFFRGEAVKRDVIADRYKPIVVRSQYGAALRLKLDKAPDGAFETAVFDADRQQIQVEDVGRGDFVRALIQVGPCWIVDRKCGCTLKALQLRTFPTTAGSVPLNLATGACLIDDDEDPYLPLEKAGVKRPPEGEDEDGKRAKRGGGGDGGGDEQR